MSTIAGSFTLNNGLNFLAGNSLTISICHTEPLTIADCLNLSGSGGKRVTNEGVINAGGVVISDGINSDSRNLTVPSVTLTDSVQVEVLIEVADLWVAVYNGSNMMIKTNEIQNVELLVGATVVTPSFTWGVQQ